MALSLPNLESRGDTLRGVGQLIGVLFLVGVVVHFIWWIVGIAVVVLIVRLAWRGYVEARAERAAEARVSAERRRRLVADADRQHVWAMARDERGIYGDYRPAM